MVIKLIYYTTFLSSCRETGVSTYERPAILDSPLVNWKNWTMLYDPVSTLCYWVNRFDGGTQWERPTGFPDQSPQKGSLSEVRRANRASYVDSCQTLFFFIDFLHFIVTFN